MNTTFTISSLIQSSSSGFVHVISQFLFSKALIDFQFSSPFSKILLACLKVKLTGSCTTYLCLFIYISLPLLLFTASCSVTGAIPKCPSSSTPPCFSVQIAFFSPDTLSTISFIYSFFLPYLYLVGLSDCCSSLISPCPLSFSLCPHCEWDLCARGHDTMLCDSFLIPL